MNELQDLGRTTIGVDRNDAISGNVYVVLIVVAVD